jgi:hypothetical protein
LDGLGTARKELEGRFRERGVEQKDNHDDGYDVVLRCACVLVT